MSRELMQLNHILQGVIPDVYQLLMMLFVEHSPTSPLATGPINPLLAMAIRVTPVAAVFMLLHLVGLSSVERVRCVFDLDEFAVQVGGR